MSAQHAANDPAIRHAWASWLVGMVVVYGVIPRALLALFCYGRWRAGIKRLHLDLNAPSYQLLKERLAPGSEMIGVVDAYQPQHTEQTPTHAANLHTGNLVVGVELDPSQDWLPSAYRDWSNAGVVDSREQRSALLNQLSAQPVQRLCVVCDARRSPDRGTLYLLKELANNAEHSVIYLLNPDTARLSLWQQALSEQGLGYLNEPSKESPDV